MKALVLDNDGNVSSKQLLKGDVMLDQVDNTPDANKPVSTPQQNALNSKVDSIRQINGKPLTSDVVLTKGDLNLSNVDNTSDVNKPISIAQQNALNTKVDSTRQINGKALTSDVTLTKGDLNLSNVDNTSDANKPVSAPQQAVFDVLNSAVNLNKFFAQLAILQGKKKAVTAQKATISVDNSPLYCFSVNNNSANQARQIINAVYLDSLFNTKQDASINGKGRILVNPKVGGVLTIPMSSIGLQANNSSVNNLSIALDTVVAKCKYLAVGDSITAQLLTDTDGSAREYWGYPSKVMLNNLKDNIDKNTVPAMVLLGHLNFQSRTTSYKGNTLTIRGGNAAQSGWAGCQYLYHAIQLTGIVTGISYMAAPNISYYLLGLKAQTGVDFTATTAQQELIRTTIMGKNACDKISALYDWMKVQVGWGGANDTYASTTTQNTNMDNFLEYLLDNPTNPFYSKTKARTGGATNAFSLATYLSKYKTLADDGTTRLTVGSTAGTKVTDVNAYDVCTPTHVSFNFGENDFWLFPQVTATQMASILRELANTVIAEYASIKVGLLTNPRPGTNYPDLFQEGIRFTKSDSLLLKSQLRTALIANIGATQTVFKSGNVYYIDTYMNTYPLTHSYDNAGETAGGTIDFEESTLSGVHLGLKGQASIGDQVYGWLYYSTLN